MKKTQLEDESMEAERIADWPRREAYEFFSRISDPFYALTFRQDVTELLHVVKERGLSFYYSMIWVCTRAINAVPAFRAAIRGGEPVLLPRREPSFTDLKPGAEQFHIVTMPADEPLEDFVRHAAGKSRAQTGFINEAEESDALIYFSCLPWVELTSLTNERNRADPAFADDSIPRIAWGKYVWENGRAVLGLSMELNHRLIDGLHVGLFAEELNRQIRRLTEI